MTGEGRVENLSRIRLANLLAPVTSETNMGGPLGWIAEAGDIIDVRPIRNFALSLNDP